MSFFADAYLGIDRSFTNDQKYQESKKFFGANVQLESNGAILALAPMDMSPRKGCITSLKNVTKCPSEESPSDTGHQCQCRAFRRSTRDSGRVYKAELDNQVWSRYNGLHSYSHATRVSSMSGSNDF